MALRESCNAHRLAKLKLLDDGEAGGAAGFLVLRLVMVVVKRMASDDGDVVGDVD